MKVLQLNLSDYHLNGGTGIAMHRLHLGLRNAGIDSKILCRLKHLVLLKILQLYHVLFL